MTQPLVTCLCLTMAGRGSFLRMAIDCFRSQTYENRELLIVSDQWRDTAHSLDKDGMIPEGERISIYVPLGGKKNIGQKRNLGCESAAGDLIAIWDDDDFYAPGRLAQQVKELQITGKAATGYKQMKFQTLRGDWFQFRYPESGFVFGSSLCFRRDWWQKHPFPEIQIGEDAAFCEAAHLENQLAEVPDLNLMFSIIHDGNTSRRDTSQPGWISLPDFRWVV